MRRSSRKNSRCSSHVGIILLILTVGCDAAVTDLSESSPAATVQSTTAETLAPIMGVWAGVVTNAVDLNNASFGRDPSEWVGHTVRGTFSIYPGTPGLTDSNSDPQEWLIQPITWPGPGPFIEFVEVTATIDGVLFQTNCGGMSPIFFGDVVRIRSGENSLFWPQDSCVGVRDGAIARSIVGFDAFFAPGTVTVESGTLAFAGPPTFAYGVINDLYDVAGAARRDATIFFQVSEVTLTPLGPLVSMLLHLEGLGTLEPDQISGLDDKLEEVSIKLDDGNIRAACNQLTAFANQVHAFMNSGSLPAELGQPLIDETDAVKGALGC